MENKDKDKSNFQKLWENPQSKAGIKLLMYLVFIGLVVLFINFAPKGDISVNEKPKITVQDMKENLLNNNYHFEYIIVNYDNVKTIYKGTKNEGKIEGTKETTEKVTKYIVDETGIYETILGEKIIMTNLYENIDESFVDIKYVLDLVNDKSTFISTRDGKKEYNYQFLINNKECEITMRTDNKNINNIYINYDAIIYDLSFSNLDI